jgi:riboflavin kinase/FMN adenylyltransferase
MKVVSWEEYLAGALVDLPFAATIGVFDGLHIGHRALVARVLAHEALASAVLTFRENPKRILSPHTHRGELSTLDQKLGLIESLSVDFCVLIDFSGDFSKLPGRSFLSILRDSGMLRFLAVGEDFRCGRGLDTAAADIGAFCEESSIGIELVPALRWEGQAVSSSRIRKAVTEGRLDEAQAMLGRPYEIDLRAALPLPGGRLAPKGEQARPPTGRYEALLVLGSALRAVPVNARLGSDGVWTLAAEGEGRGSSPPADASTAEGLGLLKLVSRE